jgi:UDP-2,4-diacetamido-2,4,6-trideoxy-beta-L-altropyranose hydrolase
MGGQLGLSNKPILIARVTTIPGIGRIIPASAERPGVHLAIRADGGPDIGYGHLIRTSALASEAVSRGHRVTYATTTPAAVADSCPDSTSMTTLPARGDPDPFVDWLRRDDPDAVYADAYPVDTAYQRAVRERVPLVVAGDDDRHTLCADAFVNGNIYAAEIEYDYVGSEPAWYLGTEYLLLRDVVTRLTDRPPSRSETAQEILVTMGGSDVLGRTPAVIRALEGLDATVTVVIGPGFSNGDEIRRASASADIDCTAVEAPPDLPKRMYDADLAITACGSTSYELLALGTPFVAIVQAPNQRAIANALDERGLACVLPMDATGEDLRDATATLLGDPERRHRYREHGRQAIPGTGPKNVCDAVIRVVQP